MFYYIMFTKKFCFKIYNIPLIYLIFFWTVISTFSFNAKMFLIWNYMLLTTETQFL